MISYWGWALEKAGLIPPASNMDICVIWNDGLMMD